MNGGRCARRSNKILGHQQDGRGLGGKPKRARERQQQRQPRSMKLEAIVLNPQETTEFEIVCVELATGGMAFHSVVGFTPNEMLAVKMPIRNRAGRLILCRICHCTPTADGSYVVGVKFVEAVTMSDGRYTIPTTWLAHHPRPVTPVEPVLTVPIICSKAAE